MGRLLAPYGIKGWVKVRPYTATPEALLEYGTWWLAPMSSGAGTAEASWTDFRVAEARPHANTLVAELRGLSTREDAMTWRGALVGVPRAKLPKTAKDEYYWAELIGLEVVNRSSQALGRVVGLLESGAHPVLRVVGDGEIERLIPLVPVFLDAIDPAAGRIVVDWQLDY